MIPFSLTTLAFLLACAVALLTATETLLGKCASDQDILLFNCSKIGIAEMPEVTHIPLNSKTVDFSGNLIHNISVLDYEALNDALRTLNLSDNQIAVLAKDAFKTLKNLDRLDLSGNRLVGKTLDEYMFNDLRFLTYLTMERNPLRYIKTNTFNFMELANLERLDLSHCEISFIENSGIDLSNLMYLDLSWNQLKSFTDDTFKMMTNLKTLDMSHNRIRVLDAVPYMPYLTTWILDSNGMEEIHIANHVSYFADALENLYLRNNEITRFGPEDLPLEMESLKLLDMNDNRLRCDCKMKWIAQREFDIEDKNIKIPCRYPSSLYNQNLLTVQENQLTCNIPMAKLIVIIVAASIVGVILIIVAFVTIRRHRRRHKHKPQKGDEGGDYAAVYSRDDEDVRVTMSDSKTLLENDKEFDV